MTDAPLAALLPRAGEPPLSADAVLDRFVGYVTQTGLSLYPAQEEAILELLGGKHLVLATPTGSGKSLVALAFHFQAMAEGKRRWRFRPDHRTSCDAGAMIVKTRRARP